jgi:DNA excision repair protein ERCC-2
MSASAGGVLLLDSPTGTGKTAMALAGLLNAAGDDEKVVVLTRTHSQYDNFLREVAAINKAGYALTCGFLMGKEKVCPVGVSRFKCSGAQRKALKSLDKGSAIPSKGTYLRDCAQKLRHGVLGFGCPYYVNTYERDPYGKIRLRAAAAELVKRQHDSPLLVEDFLAACDTSHYPLCPYEVMKNTLPQAKVLILHYLYFIDSRIYGKLYEGDWIGCTPEDTHVLIDEAHNIRENIVEQNSEEFQFIALRESAGFLEDSANKRGDFDLSQMGADVVEACALLSSVEAEVREWFSGQIISKGLVSDVTLLLDSERVASSMWLLWEKKPVFSVDEPRMACLKKVADEVSWQFQAMAASEKLPDVFDAPVICTVAKVLDGYYRLTEDRYLKFLGFERPEQGTLGTAAVEDYNLRFNVSDIDPRDILGNLANKSKSVTLMSGTLHPTDLFKNLLFYPGVVVGRHEMTNPFPKENRTLAIVSDVTTAFGQRNVADNVKSTEAVIRALASAGGNVGLFFPSYDMLGAYAETCRKCCLDLGKQLLSEQSTKDKNALIRQFKSASNAMVVGVCRGSLSEGIDYPGQQMLAVAVIGVPLARFSKYQMRIMDYYSRRHMDGETLTYNLPAVIAASQALGRCIRSEKDKGFLILADSRYLYPKYNQLLPEWMQREAISVKSSQLAALLGRKSNPPRSAT